MLSVLCVRYFCFNFHSFKRSIYIPLLISSLTQLHSGIIAFKKIFEFICHFFNGTLIIQDYGIYLHVTVNFLFYFLLLILLCGFSIMGMYNNCVIETNVLRCEDTKPYTCLIPKQRCTLGENVPNIVKIECCHCPCYGCSCLF